MSKHTPEPWPNFIDVCYPASPHPDSDGLVDLNFNDYYRASKCVNACAGMADPAAEIAELKRQRDELLAALGVAIPLIKQARLDLCYQNVECDDEDVVTPYDAILYSPVILLLETKGSAS